MNTFVITGYPRSRTAWLANFLTYGSSFCYHEPPRDTVPFKEFFTLARTPTVGISDCRAIFYIDFYLDLFPATKIVLIKRDKAEVIASLARFGFVFDLSVDTYDAAINNMIERYPVFITDFHHMDLRKIWEYCVPTEPVNELRLAMLNEFKIELFNVLMHQRHDQPVQQ